MKSNKAVMIYRCLYAKEYRSEIDLNFQGERERLGTDHVQRKWRDKSVDKKGQ